MVTLAVALSTLVPEEYAVKGVPAGTFVLPTIRAPFT